MTGEPPALLILKPEPLLPLPLLQVGVLVGHAAGGRELVLEALRTPDHEGLAAASLDGGTAVAGAQRSGRKSTGGSGSSSAAPALRIDAEWVSEHAAQVARLLPGGLSICGVYVACPVASLGASTGALVALLGELQEEVGGEAVAPSLVLHVDMPSGRLALKEQRAGESTLQPCEVKSSDVRGQLVTLVARWVGD